MSGHIQRRGNSWRLKFDIGIDADGKRRSRYHTFKGTKRDAQIKLALLIAENAKGEYVDTSKITIAEFVERWLRDWAQSHVSAKTFERYAELLRNHVVRHVGKLPLQKLRAININELYGTLLQGPPPLAPRTVGHVHRAFRRALGHAHRWGLVYQNVAGLVTPPRVAATEIEILATEQVRALLQRLEQHSIHPLAVLALATGMRRGELLALRWCDVDLDGAVLQARATLDHFAADGRCGPARALEGTTGAASQAWPRQSVGRCPGVRHLAGQNSLSQ